MTPTQSQGDQVAQFEPGQFSPSAAVSLFRPITTAQGRRAVNPLTGEILPALYIGRLVPNSGNFTNGMVVYEGTPQQRSPFRAAPRLGFAWDVTGDGRTAVRGGAGVFYDRYSDDNILDLIELPPVLNTYRANYTTIQALLSSPLTATPDRRAADRGVHPSGRLQLEPGRAAGDRLESRRRRGLRRQRRARSADRSADQRADVRLRVSAVQPGFRRTSRAGRRSPFRTICSVPLRGTAGSRNARSWATRITTRCSSR